MKLQERHRPRIRLRRRAERVATIGPPGQHLDAGRRRGRRWVVVGVVAVVLVAAGVGWLVTGPLRRPPSLVFAPEVDAYVSTAHPDANYGMAPILRADATPKIRSYLRFRLTGLSGRVVRAELRLWSPIGDLTGFTVHPVANLRWDEFAITSRNGPVPGKPAASSGPFGPETWSRADVTGLVEGKDGLSVLVASSSPQTVAFDSREGLHKPQLVIETKPGSDLSAAEPATSAQWLRGTIENASGATGVRYGTRDDRGRLTVRTACCGQS